MTRGSMAAMVVIVVLILFRVGLRTGLQLEGRALHLDVLLISDASIVFTALLFTVRSLEMWLRAKKVMEQAKPCPEAPCLLPRAHEQDPRQRGRQTADIRDHFPSRRRQDHADGTPAFAGRGDPCGGPGQGAGRGAAAKSDWMKIEQERGISVTSAVMTFEYQDAVFNLLDTPGHEDFPKTLIAP